MSKQQEAALAKEIRQMGREKLIAECVRQAKKVSYLLDEIQDVCSEDDHLKLKTEIRDSLWALLPKMLVIVAHLTEENKYSAEAGFGGVLMETVSNMVSEIDTDLVTTHGKRYADVLNTLARRFGYAALGIEVEVDD